MRGVNWNSKNRTYSPIVGEKARERARRAQELSDQGWSEARLSATLGCSPQRVREYLMPHPRREKSSG